MRAAAVAYSTENLTVLRATSPDSDPIEAFQILREDAPARRGYSASQQPEGPFWIAFTLDGRVAHGSIVVELRMLRTAEPRFWLDRSRVIAVERPTPLDSRTEKGGTTLRLFLEKDEKVDVIGRVEPIGVARPKVFIYQQEDYLESERLFERAGGALLGAFLTLAVFSVFVGAVNRDWSFFLFSGWLITSLRVVLINDGWDLTWLGVNLPNEILLVSLRVSLACHVLLTVGLFRSLLGQELRSLRLDPLFKWALVALGAIVVAGAFLPHRFFLPMVWAAAGIAISLGLHSLAVIVIRARTSVSIWYAASWCTTFLGSLVEVGYASGILANALPALNAQTASTASALLTAIALAEKLRQERKARLIAQKESVEVLKRFKGNYNSMPIGLFSIAQSGTLSLFNPAFREMFSIAPHCESGQKLHIDELLGHGTFSELASFAASDSVKDLEFVGKNELHSKRWYLARVTKKDDSIEGSIQDITTRKKAEHQLKHLVDHDHLTGLRNRRGLEASLAEAIRQVHNGGQCAIAYVDLDRFKLINDLHGHGTGDALLQQTARRLKSAVRARDHVARIADAFVVVFMDCPEHAVVGLTERIREIVGDAPFEVDNKGLNMTVSVGVVSIDPSMSSVDAMAAADRACNEAKARGRNCVFRLTDKDAALRMHLEELKVIADLQQRVPTERYFLEFQPIVALQSAMASMSYEVLIRMREEGGRVIPPGKFIGAAERNGLMSQIDRWVLRSTLEWLDDHPDHRDRLAFATINISGASLNDIRFVDDAFAMIAEHPLAMPKLCFEITESVALLDLGSTRRFVERVRMYGSKLALDDFGAGYTSFNYLKEIPADFIKIDGSFVKEINRNPANYAITRMIVDLTHELGMRSIAEWAETPDTIASLIQLGVDYGQGFGLARPMAPEVVTAATSGGALVNDPLVLTLLHEGSAGARIAAAAGRARRRQIAR